SRRSARLAVRHRPPPRCAVVFARRRRCRARVPDRRARVQAAAAAAGHVSVRRCRGRRVGPVRAGAVAPRGRTEKPSMRRAVLSAVAALAVAGAAGAMPTWTMPHVLAHAGIALAPEIAANGSAGAVAVWDQETGPDCLTSPASLTCIHTVETA